MYLYIKVIITILIPTMIIIIHTLIYVFFIINTHFHYLFHYIIKFYYFQINQENINSRNRLKIIIHCLIRKISLQIYLY